ncbi:MAG TPA: hypothetical protein VFV43_09855 [Limnobacter sp.]|nr:hypothetical protein [Limnobacter sp.]
MSTQVIGTVNELEGEVTVMRDGQTVALSAGDSISAGDVITASDSGRASIVLSNSYGEPIGNLLVAPTGSVIADTTTKSGQTAYIFEALSDDGVTIANLDPDFAELVELQGVEQAGQSGGMFGLFDGGLLAAGTLGGSGLAVGAGAVGIAALASGSDEGTGPANSTGGGNGGGNGGGDGGGDGDGGDAGGTTGTPLDAGLDPIFAGAADTPLAAVTEPLADGLGTVAGMFPMPGGEDGGGENDGDTGGGDTGGTTGTPLDAALDPLFGAAADTPLSAATEPLADGLATLASMSPAGGGEAGFEGPTGTPLDLALEPLLGATEGTPLSAITSMADPSILADQLGGAGLPV